MAKPFISINGVELLEYDNYEPNNMPPITKGGRNALTGKMRLRIIAKKWKVVISSNFISDTEYKKITDEIDKDPLNINVCFRDKNEELVEFVGYAVYTKSLKTGDDAMGGWSNFSLELIEN